MLEDSILQSPVVIPRSLISGKDATGRRSDFFRLHQSARFAPRLQALESLASFGHRPLALSLFVRPAVVRIDHEHPQVFFAGFHFLHSRLRRRLFLTRCDAHRTGLPLRFIQGLKPTVQLLIAAAFDPQQKALFAIPDLRFRLFADHAAIAHEHHPLESKTGFEILQHVLHRARVFPVAGKDMMRDRPTRDHHHADQNLHVLRLAVAAIAMLGDCQSVANLVLTDKISSIGIV